MQRRHLRTEMALVYAAAIGKARIASGTEGGFAYNAPKVLKASHVIALCTRNDMTEEHLQALLEQEALP